MFFSKTASVAKLFFLLSSSGLVIYAMLAFYSFHTSYVSLSRSNNIHASKNIYIGPALETIESNSGKDVKYILMYSTNVNRKHYRSPFIEGQYHFNKHKCSQRNCYLTTKEQLLNKDIRNFEAIVMNVKDLPYMKLPELRTAKQKYIFYGMDAPSAKLACRKELDNYFNGTWSFKLYSDILSPFFEVRNMKGEIVAPRPTVHWSKEIATTYLKADEISVYQKKKKAVVAFVRTCHFKEHIYQRKLRSALEFYSLTLDIYGCGINCPNTNIGDGCDKVIENDYYFVLIEKIFADDYLTDDVLKAYLNNAVPLIRSGAMLSNFLPTGSYINIRPDSVEKVAALIHYSIDNPAVYHSYFRWKKFYTFHRSTDFSGICDLCSLLNNKKWMYHHKSYRTLRKWWYPGPIDESFCTNTTFINTTELIRF